MRIEVLLHIFPFSWDQIALASWLKYPNASRPDILGLDVIDRHYDHESGTLSAYRVSLLKGMVPNWVCSVTGGCLCLFLEKSIIKPKEKFMQLVSENITCNQFLQLQEICTYTQDPEDPQKTHFKQEMKITAYIWGVSGQLEKIGADNFKANALGGRDVMTNAVGLIPQAIRGLVFDPKATQATLQKH